MRVGAVLTSLAIVATACGTTADDMGTDTSGVATITAPTTSAATTLAPTASSSSTAVVASESVVSTAPRGAWPSTSTFDEHGMNLLFPPDQPTLVVWVLPPEQPTIGRIHLRLDGPDGEAADDQWDLPPPGEGLHLLTQLSVPANTYEVTVMLTELSTDTSSAQPVRGPLSCVTTVDVPPRATAGIRLLLPVSSETGVEARDCVYLPFSQWLDVEGRPVSPDDLIDWPGPSHCDWQDAHFLNLSTAEYTQYVRDPKGTIDSDSFEAPDGSTLTFTELAVLPPDAVFSGFRSNGRELWFAPGGEYAYLRTVDAVERWPRASRPFYCL